MITRKRLWVTALVRVAANVAWGLIARRSWDTGFLLYSAGCLNVGSWMWFALGGYVGKK